MALTLDKAKAKELRKEQKNNINEEPVDTPNKFEAYLPTLE
jgi:hypothetical protein